MRDGSGRRRLRRGGGYDQGEDDHLRIESLVALIAAGMGILLAAARAYLEQYELAFWSLAVGFALFYGIGCFAVWCVEHPTPEDRAKREPAWFAHMYWTNFLGCLVGWGAARLLYLRFDNGCDLGWVDVLLALAAFLGIIGWLPYAVIGMAHSFRYIVDKLMPSSK
jgi:hypothetical protein